MPASAPKPEQWRIQTAGVLMRSDREILSLLERSRRDINTMLREVASRPGLGSKIREQQLLLVKRELQAEMARVWTSIGDIVAARRVEAANRVIDLNAALDTFMLAAAGVDDASGLARRIADSEADRARTGIDRMLARVAGSSYVPLARRVYTSSVSISSRISKTVDSALARGLSAREFAREIAGSGLINPKTPGGVRYAALRLARTEINNAAHAVAVSASAEKPWILGQQWNLSRSHPKADDCDRLARGGRNGDGIYPKDSVPKKPHPQCFCYLTPVPVEEETFLDNLVGGQYNDYIARYPKGVVQATAPAPSVTAPPRPAATISSPGVSAIRLKAAIDRINQVRDSTGKRVVEAELLEQGRLVPNSLLRLYDVKQVDRADIERSFGVNSNTIAYYNHDFREMRLQDTIFRPQFAEVFERSLSTGFWSKYGRTGPDGTVAHEFGHHVSNMIRSGGSPTERRLFLESVSDHLGIDPPPDLALDTLNKWVQGNKDAIKRNVGGYATTSFEELMAEIWVEYSTSGASARPPIQAIGELMRELAERAAVRMR